MTQDHSALLAQLDALKSADAGAVFAELIRAGLQALIEAEATEAIGAGRYQRTDGRTVHRNGHRPKTVSTTAGDVEVQIPKLRAGSFFPSLLERRRRIDKALHAVIMEAYVHGVSTRSVDDLVAAMGVDSGVSKSEVSRICAGLDKEIEAFRTRSLAHTTFPYVFCDATFCKVRIGAHVVSQALVVATGVSIDGTREVLGTAVGDSESYEFWREFLASLKARGLAGVHLVISDAHAGLKAAVAQQFTGSSWQRCRVHFMRNLHTAVSAKHAPAVTAAVKTIFAHTDPADVAAQWDRVADTLAGVVPEGGGHDGRGQDRRAGVHRVPEGALAEDLVEQSDRAVEQGDQAPRRCRGDLPQPGGVPAPGHRGGHRSPRRMAGHPPLPLRCLHGRTAHRHRRQTRRRSTGQTTPNHLAFNMTR